MAWTIKIGVPAQRDLDKFDPQIARRILNFLFVRVLSLENPRDIGEALQGSKLGDYWKYRVGDYRVIVEFKDNDLCILLLEVGHRKEIYR